MNRFTALRIGLILPLFCIGACATLNDAPQSPCARATRASNVADALVGVAQAAGDPNVISRAIEAANAARIAAAAVCAVRPS